VQRNCEMHREERPVSEMPAELQQILAENK